MQNKDKNILEENNCPHCGKCRHTKPRKYNRYTELKNDIVMEAIRNPVPKKEIYDRIKRAGSKYPAQQFIHFKKYWKENGIEIRELDGQIYCVGVLQ